MRAEDAWHEAAHVVVGVAMGLRLERATLRPRRAGWLGYAWFPAAHGVRGALMYAAGVAWERSSTSPRRAADRASGDLSILRARGYSRADIDAYAAAALALLSTRGVALARVASALLEHETLTGRDVAALATAARLPKSTRLG